MRGATIAVPPCSTSGFATLPGCHQHTVCTLITPRAAGLVGSLAGIRPPSGGLRAPSTPPSRAPSFPCRPGRRVRKAGLCGIAGGEPELPDSEITRVQFQLVFDPSRAAGLDASAVERKPSMPPYGTPPASVEPAEVLTCIASVGPEIMTVRRGRGFRTSLVILSSGGVPPGWSATRLHVGGFLRGGQSRRARRPIETRATSVTGVSEKLHVM